MTTARDIIKSALRKISALGVGTDLNNEDAQDALSALNTMVASFSVEGGMIYYTSSETFPLTSSATYTIGAGGDFDTARPFDIQSAFTSTGDIDYFMTSYDSTEYAAIAQKNIGGIPKVYFYDNNFPLATITLYYTPVGVSTITLNSRKHLDGFATLDTVYNLPPEYQAMLEFNLAVWIAPEYEREPLPSVQRLANRTYTAVVGQNKRNEKNLSSIDAPRAESRIGTGNIYEGYS